MQLLRFQVGYFRNLQRLELRFPTHLESEEGGAGRAIRSHALIGQNGTGKSNLIEALITIFRDVDLDRDAAFDYRLEYAIRGHTVCIEAETGRQKRPFVRVDGEARSQGYLLKNRELLPSHIFVYYSGRNERIEALFQEHQRRFNRRQEVSAEEVLSRGAIRGGGAEEALEANAARWRRLGDDRLRRLFYCRGGHSQLVLLACLLSDDPVFRKVLDNLHIESLESALFVLKEPHRLREKRKGGRFDQNELNEGDPRPR